jgi:hypothetical protein
VASRNNGKTNEQCMPRVSRVSLAQAGQGRGT